MNYSGNGHSDNGDNEFDWSVRKDLSDWINMLSVDKGRQIYGPDEKLEYFHLLQNGLLGIYKLIPPDNSILVGKVHPNQTIGITQMMLDGSFPGHVRVMKGSVLLQGTKEDLKKVKNKFPEAVTRVILEETCHYNAIYQRIEQVLSENIEQKIARELLDLARIIGRDTRRGVEMVVGLTRKEISNMVGCTHESASRVMSEWEKEGTIKTRQKNITLQNLTKLRGTINSDDLLMHSSNLKGSVK